MEKISQVLALVTLLVVTSCASPDADSGVCARRDDQTYVARYVERSGTCGEGAEVVINAGPQPTSVDAPCKGSISYSADNCEVTYESECPNDGAVKGATLIVTGKSTWAEDASSGSAIEQWTLRDRDGKTVCMSTYDVTVTRR